MSTRLLFVYVLIMISATGWSAPSTRASYDIFDLGVVGRTACAATSINDSGQIVGYWRDGASMYGYLWEGGTLTDLGTCLPMDINNSRQISGSVLSAIYPEIQGFLWQEGVMSKFNLGYRVTYGRAINDLGDLAIQAFDTNQPSHSFIHTPGITIEIIGPVPGVEVHGINNARQVVGDYPSSTGPRAYIWQNGVMHDLPGLDGSSSLADAINANGHVVGYSDSRRVTLWRDGTALDLGVCLAPPTNTGISLGINNLDQVVGSFCSLGQPRAFLYMNGKAQDLNGLIPQDSGWLLTAANDINESGWIVGAGILNGQPHAFLLTPEPATALLLLGGTLLFRRRSQT